MASLTSKLLRTFPRTLINNFSQTIRFSSNSKPFKAAVVKLQNAPLIIEERKPAKLEPNEVRIQVNYCSVNSVDCKHFKDGTMKLPFVPGYEFSGEVTEVGKSVPKDRVSLGENVVAFNPDKFGGFAEQCVVSVDDVWRLPSNVSVKNAAVLIYGHSTAVYAFTKLHKPSDGDHVVVSAGPAGLGLAAVDVAANVYKAKVIGVVDSDDRAELVRQRGAFETVIFHDQLRKEIFKKTDKKGADIVYDAVGEHMLPIIGGCVGSMGNVFHAAPYHYDNIPAPPPNSLLSIVSLSALRTSDTKTYRNIIGDTLELAGEGVLAAHVSATFNLSQVNDAIKYIEDKKCTGKVLIKIDD